MSNYWLLVQDDPRVVLGSGFGSVSPGAGEYVLLFDTRELLEAHEVTIRPKAYEQALVELVQTEKKKSDQAYVYKTQCAELFLTNEAANEGVVSPTDPAVIDPLLYECLYDEYWNTYDLMSDTPWDLARSIVANSNRSMDEANRRRDKLLQLAVIEADDPVIPDEPT